MRVETYGGKSGKETSLSCGHLFDKDQCFIFPYNHEEDLHSMKSVVNVELNDILVEVFV